MVSGWTSVTNIRVKSHFVQELLSGLTDRHTPNRQFYLDHLIVGINRNNFIFFAEIITAALRSRCGHYIFILWFLLAFFFFISLPNLSGRRLDVYHTSTHGVALVRNLECRSETCCARLADNTGCKMSPKLAIWVPSHNFVGLYLRN